MAVVSQIQSPETAEYRPPSVRRALGPTQERRLVSFLDERFLDLTRNHKKRSEPTTSLPTLQAYLTTVRQLLATILQIPPIDPSTSLRTAYLLRLTGDVLGGIPGYRVAVSSTDTIAVSDAVRLAVNPGPVQYKDTLQDLLDFLDDLDQAWLAVLQSQVWDPSAGTGVDLVLDSDAVTQGIKSTPISQTEVTRLRSLLIGGQAALEEWLAAEKIDGFDSESDDVSGMLESMGLLDDFDELFSRTLDYLSGYGGVVADPQSDIVDMEL